jgi:hypothetical protein
LLCEAGTAKDWGILAAESECFKRQCDCFVTKRLARQQLALKEVTDQLQGSNSVYGKNRAMGKGYSVNLKEKLFKQTRKIKRNGAKNS